MSDACYLSRAGGPLVAAENFLSTIDRDPQFGVRLGNNSVRYFGYCQGCRNKVLHGQFTRNEKIVQFFRHHAAMYNLDELQSMEACGWYEPDNGRGATAAVVRDDLKELVFEYLRSNAYGVWRTLNSYVLRGVGKIGKNFFTETVQEILARRRIASGFGFSVSLLPFYILSQINGGEGTLERRRMQRRATIWLEDDPVPNDGWTYIHFSLLPEYRRRDRMGIRFLTQNRSRAPTLVHALECNTREFNGVSYLKAIEEFEREAERWIAMPESELRRRYPSNAEVLLRYRSDSQDFRRLFL